MKPIIQLHHISDINNFVKSKTNHPMVAVVDFSKADDYIEEGTRISADFYTIMFKNYCANKLRYGRQSYDFQEGNLICIAPKQVLTMDNEIEKRDDMMGWGLFFHPDLLRGTSLGDKMSEYTFFSYDMTEALHLSDKEKQILYDCIQKIEIELQENIDNHSQNLIVTNIELLLNYCSRYYGRQFITRKNSNSNTVIQIENLLKMYFKSDKLKETGMNAQDHIHYYIIEEAKNALLNSDHSVSEVAYSLGFEYPQYFSKLFKQKTGQTPIEYRSLN